MQTLQSSLENAIKSINVAWNELSPTSKLPPETLATISKFIVEPRTLESMFEIMKMTHVCQYWRSTLISYPHLWLVVFVQKHHKDLIVACLERSRGVPLAVCLDLVAGVPYRCPGNTREQVVKYVQIGSVRSHLP